MTERSAEGAGLVLIISPHGRLMVEPAGHNSDSGLKGDIGEQVRGAFTEGSAAGLLHLATEQLRTAFPPSFAFARQIAQQYLTRLCRTPAGDGGVVLSIPQPPREELAFLAFQAPPMKGLEYLTADVVGGWWTEMDELVGSQVARVSGGAQAWLQERNPLWRLVGRVTFHLAENKRDEQFPFGFLATYSSRLSAQGRVQHLPLGNALREYAGAKDRQTLLSLLTPVQQASERSAFVKELVDSGDIYHPLAWTPREAYQFLQELPLYEESGVVVQVPDWWKRQHPPRPVVSVRIGEHAKARLGADALLDFSLAVTLEGQPITEEELREILASPGGLVALRGKWVEVDRDKLEQALSHWKQVEKEARQGGISFFDGMRLLAGAEVGSAGAAIAPAEAREWSGVTPGEWLHQTLSQLRDPAALGPASPTDLHAQLRPYQEAGVNWLRFMTRLGLGACLADDMGLGKTIQVLALLLHLRDSRGGGNGDVTPSLLVVPASLLANWKSEISRFAPSLSVRVDHPSEPEFDADPSAKVAGLDLVITSYGMLNRLDWVRQRPWNLVVLDEAQAIKNAGTRQARAVKELKCGARIALTGTPVENRLSDLWSLFDFINPGLLGGSKAFATFAKELARRTDNPYGPLRALVRPYILRRLKTDKSVIADLPEKTEVNAFCSLSRKQATLYERSVQELASELKSAAGIQRKGLVLAYLMRFKQICNHPSQWLGDGRYDPVESGKFQRLAELCGQIAERQEKVLIFSQFREITGPLSEYLAGVFGRPGLVLHGGTAVKNRRELVEFFQRDDGPPFFVLSLKAGGTGLNLTAASHVIHFDRWWNPAVENQATDRAFRIGQKKNVLVHKFVCRGTVEDKIDELIGQKVGLSKELLEGGGEKLLTEMDDRELLDFVALDIHRAVEA